MQRLKFRSIDCTADGAGGGLIEGISVIADRVWVWLKILLEAADPEGGPPQPLRENPFMDNAMPQIQELATFSGPLQMWVHDVLAWIGFGTLVGLLARALMPGRDPGGAVITLALGIGGAVIGCGTWALTVEGQRITPVSPIGIIVATGGAFGLLFFYRLLGGYWFREDEDAVANRQRRRVYRPRRSRSVYVDE